MKLSFHGAARSVTGSRHMLEVPGFKLLLDCGLFQGRRDEAYRKNRDLGFDPKSLNAVLLSHAHVDHSGALPVLQKHGFSGKVYLTRATADLTELMLEDSARIQMSDCGYVNKQEQRKGKTCVQPLYNTEDVRKLVRRFEGGRYGDILKIAPRVTASFHDAGHILGSAAIRVKYTARGSTTTVLFSGDLGRSNMPILRDPESPPPCDVLILESTYGDRLHEADRAIMKQQALDLSSMPKLTRARLSSPRSPLDGPKNWSCGSRSWSVRGVSILSRSISILRWLHGPQRSFAVTRSDTMKRPPVPSHPRATSSPHAISTLSRRRKTASV